MRSVTIITSPFACVPPHAIGAIERRWYQVSCLWRKQGLTVHMVAKLPLKEYKGEDWINYIPGYNRTGKLWKDIILDAIYSWRALKKAKNADVLILNSFWSPIFFPLFKRKFKLVMYNVARFPKRQMGIYKKMDILSCVSSAVRDAVVEQSPKMADKTTFINNPIDTDVFNANMPHSFTKDIKVVYSGRVHSEKGLDILIKAINELRKTNEKITLTVIGARDVAHGGGGDDYINFLNDCAKGWHVQWIDPIYDSRELAMKLSQYDVFCYPSVADKGETFGVAPLEAMGLGLVTIVSALGCFRDFINDGENGIVFNHHTENPERELVHAFMKILNNGELYENISANAIKTSKRFCIDNIANNYIELFEKKLREKEYSISK